jgi:hypothetical protein
MTRASAISGDKNVENYQPRRIWQSQERPDLVVCVCSKLYGATPSWRGGSRSGGASTADGRSATSCCSPASSSTSQARPRYDPEQPRVSRLGARCGDDLSSTDGNLLGNNLQLQKLLELSLVACFVHRCNGHLLLVENMSHVRSADPYKSG